MARVGINEIYTPDMVFANPRPDDNKIREEKKSKSKAALKVAMAAGSIAEIATSLIEAKELREAVVR